MSLTIIEIDGKEYHADDEGKPLREENGDLIPAHICLCWAHGPSECVCGAWDREIPENE